jgi:hypothetical protein
MEQGSPPKSGGQKVNDSSERKQNAVCSMFDIERNTKKVRDRPHASFVDSFEGAKATDRASGELLVACLQRESFPEREGPALADRTLIGKTCTLKTG